MDGDTVTMWSWIRTEWQVFTLWRFRRKVQRVKRRADRRWQNAQQAQHRPCEPPKWKFQGRP
jgi:hypothetical protein